jgi:hypothetical protein
VRSSTRAGGNLSVASFCCVRGVCLIVGEYDEAFPRGIVASGAGVVGVAKPVVRGVEEPPEHHWVRHAGEVPLRVPVRGGGWQLAGGTVGRLVVGGGVGVPDGGDMAARANPVAPANVVQYGGRVQFIFKKILTFLYELG